MMLRVVVFVALTTTTTITTTLAQCDAGAEECSGRFCSTLVAVVANNDSLRIPVTLGLEATHANIDTLYEVNSCPGVISAATCYATFSGDPGTPDVDRIVLYFPDADGEVNIQPDARRVIVIYAGVAPPDAATRENLLSASSFPRADNFFLPRFGADANRLPIMGFVDTDNFVVEMAIGAKLALGADSMACSVFGADNNIVTFDGVPYSFQGAGEYWLVNANSQGAGDFDVQVRLQPCPDNGGATTCATAFAIRTENGADGYDVYEFERLANSRVVLRVNGELAALSSFGRNSGEDDRLLVEARGTASSPDGYNIYLRSAGALYQIQFANGASSFVMLPSAAFRGNTAGLCGNFNACKNDEFVTGGEVFQVEDTDGVYRFAEGYCVDEYDSMFFHRPAQRYPCSAANVEPVPVATTLSDIPVDVACRFYCESGHSLHGFASDELCRGVCTVRSDEGNLRDVVEIYDESNWPRYTIEPSYDDPVNAYRGPSALFSAAGDVGGKYTLKLTSTSSCDTAEREVVLNFACGAELDVDAGEPQDVATTSLGYPEVQMAGNDGGASTVNDGRGIVTYWQFTELPLSVVEPFRRVSQGYSADEDVDSDARVPIGNATEIPAFSKENCSAVFTSRLPFAEIDAIFDVARDQGYVTGAPDPSAVASTSEELIEFLDEWCPVLFDDVLAPAIRDKQSAVARWVPAAPGVYTLAFAATDGCQLAQDSVTVTVECPDCPPQGVISLGNSDPDQVLNFERERGLTPGPTWNGAGFTVLEVGRSFPSAASGIGGDFPQTTWSISRLSGERELRADSPLVLRTVLREDGDSNIVTGTLESIEGELVSYSENFDASTADLAALRGTDDALLRGTDSRFDGLVVLEGVALDSPVVLSEPPLVVEDAVRQWAVDESSATSGTYTAVTVLEEPVEQTLCTLDLLASTPPPPALAPQPQRNFEGDSLLTFPSGEPLDCVGRYRVSLDVWGMCSRTTDFVDFDVSCGAPPVAVFTSVSSIEYNTAEPMQAVPLNAAMSYSANFVAQGSADLQYSWSVLSRNGGELRDPSGVSFSDSQAADPDLLFDFNVARGGTYVIQLEVSDGCQTSTAQREVAVLCAGAPDDFDDLVITPENSLQFEGGEPPVFSIATETPFDIVLTDASAPLFPEEVQDVIDRLSGRNVAQVTRLQDAAGDAFDAAVGTFTPYLGGSYGITLLADSGCESGTEDVTLTLACQQNPTAIEFSPSSITYAIDSAAGRVYLDAGALINADLYDPDDLTEFEWVFVSYPGMEDVASPPLQDNNPILPAGTASSYNFYLSAGSDVALPGGLSANFRGGDGTSSRNPCAFPDCASFVPPTPGTYELALVYYDGCTFLASEDNLVVIVEDCSSPSAPVIDTVETFTIPDDPANAGGATSFSLTSTNTEDFEIDYEWTLAAAPEGSALSAGPLQGATGSTASQGVTQYDFTPDVEGTFTFSLLVTPSTGPAGAACGGQSTTVDVAVECDLFMPLTFPMVPSVVMWDNAGGQFPVVSLTASVGETGLSLEQFISSFDYFWSVSNAPESSTYYPLCYDGTNRGRFSGECEQSLGTTDTADGIEIDDVSDLPSDVTSFNLPDEGTTTLSYERITTRTQRYQSFVDLLPVDQSQLNSASYRRFESTFFPDAPGLYELTLQVESACRLPIYEKVTIEARCTVLADGRALGSPVSERIGEVDSPLEHRYSLDASDIYGALASDPLVAERVVFWWDWMHPGANPDDDITVNPVTYALNRRIYDEVAIYNNDRPVASFKATAGPGVYPARLTVSDGCTTREFELDVDVSCPETDQQASGDQAFGQIQEGVAGISAITVDLEQFVASSSFCAQEYRWEMVDFDPVADPITPQPSASGASGSRWLLSAAVPAAAVAAVLSWSS